MRNKRVGVYVCHCGGNISDVVDVEKVVEEIKKIDGVVVARHFMFMCSEAGQKLIEEDIHRFGLDAVVVAACSPKLHEKTFRRVVKRAGLNPYVFEHVNIREQVSWAHSHNPKEATEKAIALIRAGIAKVMRNEPLQPIKVDTTNRVLIIGAGVAGLRAALTLADMGIDVIIVEKEPFVGGNVLFWEHTFPYGEKGYEVIQKFVSEIKKRKNITIFTNAEVKSVSGVVGGFHVEIELKPRCFKAKCDKIRELIEACPVEVPNEYDFGLTKRKAIIYPNFPVYPDIPVIDMKNCTKCNKCKEICGDVVDLNDKPRKVSISVGAIIIATGFEPYEPKKGEYGYKEIPEVITLPQFMRLLALNGDGKLVYNGKEIRRIGFIYCVGSRQLRTGKEKVNEYCSRYCCTATMSTANYLHKRFPGIKIFHIYRDIRTYGFYELYYEEASRNGDIFIRYDPMDPPKVEKVNGEVIVRVKDLLTNREELEVPVDLLVLVVGMVPRENKMLESIIKINKSSDGFYQEVHPKLKPVETSTLGILLAGTAQGPKNIKESITSAAAAAAKAAGLLMKGYIELDPFKAYVDMSKCDVCGECFDACPYGAIQLREKDGKREVYVCEPLCHGCGACVPVCPKGAINVKNFREDQILAMIDALLGEMA